MDNNYNYRETPYRETPYQEQIYEEPVYQTPVHQTPVYRTSGGSVYDPPKTKGQAIAIFSLIAALVIAIVVICIMLVTGGDRKIVGTWVTDDGVVIVFEKDNTGEMEIDGISVIPIKWEYKDKNLIITYEGITKELEVRKISDEEMVLLGGDGIQENLTKIK